MNVELEFNSFPVKYTIRKLNQLVEKVDERGGNGKGFLSKKDLN